MPNAKPLLCAALICQDITDAEGFTSLHRIVDILTLNQSPPAGGPVFLATIRAYLLLKSGDFAGSGDVTFKMRFPPLPAGLGFSDPPDKYHATLNGGEHGFALRLTLNVPVVVFGVHYLDFYWNEDLIGTVPFRIAGTPGVTLPDYTKRQPPK
jgi:hypothetical protein